MHFKLDFKSLWKDALYCKSTYVNMTFMGGDHAYEIWTSLQGKVCAYMTETSNISNVHWLHPPPQKNKQKSIEVYQKVNLMIS